MSEYHGYVPEEAEEFEAPEETIEMPVPAPEPKKPGFSRRDVFKGIAAIAGMKAGEQAISKAYNAIAKSELTKTEYVEVVADEQEDPQRENERNRETVAILRRELNQEFESYRRQGLPREQWVPQLMVNMQEAIGRCENSHSKPGGVSKHVGEGLEGLGGGALVGAVAEGVADAAKVDRKQLRRGFLATMAAYAGALGMGLRSYKHTKEDALNEDLNAAYHAATQALELLPREQTKGLLPPNKLGTSNPGSVPDARIPWSVVMGEMRNLETNLKQRGVESRLGQYAVAHASLQKLRRNAMEQKMHRSKNDS